MFYTYRETFISPFLPFRRGRRNKTKFADAKLNDKDAANDSARTETTDLTRSELGACDVSAERATRADIHNAADDTPTQADSDSSETTEDMSEGGGGGKQKRGRKGRKNKNKNLNSSTDADETKQLPKNSTGGTISLTNGIADDEKVLQEVVEADLVPASATVAQLSSVPLAGKAGIQHGPTRTEDEMGLSLEFIDVVIDSSKQAPKETTDSKARDTVSGRGEGAGDGSLPSVADGESASPPPVSGDVAAVKSQADKEETDSSYSRDSMAEIEAEAEAMLALADVSMSTVSSESIDSSTGGGPGEGKPTDEEKPRSSGGLKKILRRKISKTLFNVDLEQCDPEIVVSLLKIPSVQTFGALKRKLKSSGKDWIQGFLDHDGLEALLDCVDSLGSRRVTQLSSALLLLECVACVKCVMNSKMGLELLVQRPDYVCRLVKGQQIFFSFCLVLLFRW